MREYVLLSLTDPFDQNVTPWFEAYDRRGKLIDQGPPPPAVISFAAGRTLVHASVEIHSGVLDYSTLANAEPHPLEFTWRWAQIAGVYLWRGIKYLFTGKS